MIKQSTILILQLLTTSTTYHTAAATFLTAEQKAEIESAAATIVLNFKTTQLADKGVSGP